MCMLYLPLRAGTLLVVRRLACLKDSGSYIPPGAKAPGRFNQAGQASGEGPDETQHLVLRVGGWAWG